VVSGGKREGTNPPGIALLTDLKVVFDGEDQVPSTHIVKRLKALSPEWAYLDDGGSILAKLLRSYGINSKRLTRDGRPLGYRRTQFTPAWERHLTRQTRQTAEIREKRPDSKARQQPNTRHARRAAGRKR
jgi:Protein of unknown function (DUF3631)